MDAIQTYKQAFQRPGSDLIHLNNAGIAPWPLQTERAVHDWTTRLASEGTHLDAQAFIKSDETRQLLGDLLGAKAEQIAFFQTCATAISQVAFGLNLDRGAEIVTFDQEYPSNFYPWRLAAERVDGRLVIAKSTETLATPLEAIKACVTSKTKVIAVSWVQYRNGAIMDLQALAEFAKANGILTCVDIIQGAGLLPFNFDDLGLDFACGGAHKWFTSPLSLGFLMMKPEHVERLTPLSVGAISFGGYDKLSDIEGQMVQGPLRYEPGGRALLEMIGLGETLKLMKATGIDRIAQETEWLSRKLMHGLRERGYQIHSPHGAHFRGSIVNFAPTSQSALATLEEIEERLVKAKVSFAKRPPGVRLSPHAFVTAEQIERTLEALT
jgi:selenocysteine lyase/cysteine desulfurase